VDGALSAAATAPESGNPVEIIPEAVEVIRQVVRPHPEMVVGGPNPPAYAVLPKNRETWQAPCSSIGSFEPEVVPFCSTSPDALQAGGDQYNDWRWNYDDLETMSIW